MNTTDRVIVVFSLTVFLTILLLQCWMMNGYLREIAEALKKISGMNF